MLSGLLVSLKPADRGIDLIRLTRYILRVSRLSGAIGPYHRSERREGFTALSASTHFQDCSLISLVSRR